MMFRFRFPVPIKGITAEQTLSFNIYLFLASHHSETMAAYLDYLKDEVKNYWAKLCEEVNKAWYLAEEPSTIHMIEDINRRLYTIERHYKEMRTVMIERDESEATTESMSSSSESPEESHEEDHSKKVRSDEMPVVKVEARDESEATTESMSSESCEEDCCEKVPSDENMDDGDEVVYLQTVRSSTPVNKEPGHWIYRQETWHCSPCDTPHTKVLPRRYVSEEPSSSSIGAGSSTPRPDSTYQQGSPTYSPPGSPAYDYQPTSPGASPEYTPTSPTRSPQRYQPME